MMGNMTPEQYLAWLDQYWASPTGQREQQAYDETQQLNRKSVLQGLKNQRDQIAIQKGTAEANRWYQQQQVQLAQAEHDLSVRKQAASEEQFNTTTGGYMPNGAPTLNRQQIEAGLTGMYNGAPTLANQQYVTGATGYINGAPTLAREQAATNAAISGAGLAMQAKGPRNWGSYVQGAYGVANSPASALVSSVPGGLGMAASQQTQPQTLGSVMADYGLTGRGAGGGTNFGATGDGSGMAYASGAGTGGTGGSGTLMGAFNQGGSYQPTLADYGLSDADGATLQAGIRNPNQLAPGFWESKSPTEREYLKGMMEKLWGEDPDTFENRYFNTRTRQGSAFAAV